MIDKYSYGADFQFQALALTVQDPAFLSLYSDTINPRFFEKETHEILCSIILEHYQTYRQYPDKILLLAALEDFIRQLPPGRENMIPTLRAECNDLFKVELHDIQALTDRVVLFGKRQALKAAVLGIIGEMDSNMDYGKCKGHLEKALAVGSNTKDMEDFADVMQKLPDKAKSTHLYCKKVPTMIAGIDMRTGGGVGAGELAVIVGPSGTGKSTFLTHVGGAAIQDGHPVLHISLELKLIDVELKYASFFTEMTIPEILTGGPNYFQKVKDLMTRDMLKIAYFSPRSLTSDGLAAYINKLVASGEFKPQVLIIDYPDRMRFGVDAYRDIGILYDDIINIIDKHRLVGWVGSQSGRYAQEGGTVTKEGISDSWLKVANADIVVTISQTRDEYQAAPPRCRLLLDKVRRGTSSPPFHCYIDYARSRITQVSQE